MLEIGSTEQLLIETEEYLEAAGGPEYLNFILRQDEMITANSICVYLIVQKSTTLLSSLQFISLLSCIRILAVVAIACFTWCIAQTNIWTTVGSTVTLRCTFPSLYTGWYFFGSNYDVLAFNCKIFHSVHGKFKLFANCSQEVDMTYLQIVNVSSLDEGTYTCENNFKFVDWKIKIKGQPRFQNKDSSNIIHGTEGRNLTISCILESGSRAEQLLIETGGSLVVAGVPKTLTLTLTPSRADHLAKYLCIANSSEYDNPLVDNATLYISRQPRFQNKDGSNIIHGTEGINLTLSCILEGGSYTEQLFIETGGSIVAAGGPDKLTFSLAPSRAEHLANYLCIANNSEYNNSRVDYATLYISHIPDVPANITTKIFFHNVSVSWQPGNSGNLHQVFYVQYKEEGTELWTTFGPINQTGSANMTYQISNLPYNRSHEIQVFAENDVGRSKHSELVKFAVFLEHDIKTIWRYEIGFKCWMYVGLISGGLILICIMSHVWRHYRTQITVGATLALHTEAPYDEIDSIYYQEHPPIPHNDVIMAASTIETESRNNVLEVLDDSESDAVQQGNIRVDPSFQRNSRETVLSENSHSHSSTDDRNTAAESSDKSSDNITEGHVNLYTSMLSDRPEDHPYTPLNVGNTKIRVHNDNDYINMRI